MSEIAYDLIVLRYGELFLKGENRPRFEQQLQANVRRALATVAPEARLERGQGRLFVDCPPADVARATARLTRVPGLSSLSPACAVPPDLAALAETGLRLAQQRIATRRPATFRVAAKRSDKQFPVPSPEIGRVVGERIWEATQIPVDLQQPELTIGVEVGPRRSFVFVERHVGAGGLPVGSAGRVALLLSGGIDSPVAGHLLQKRGCVLHGVHFHSPPYTGARSRAKVEELARLLCPEQEELTLEVVNFTPLQTTIRDRAPGDLAVVLYRRAMLRIAAVLARRASCLALATGDNLGQVASQTLENLACIERATDLPVLRPLLTYDKAETIALAERLGTYNLSVEPYDDCCSLFVPRHPATRARHEAVERIEALLDLQPLLDEAAMGAERVTLRG